MRKKAMKVIYTLLSAALCCSLSNAYSQETRPDNVHPDARYTEGLTMNIKLEGFSGIWYANQPSDDEYAYKYSGGLATYTANHNPMAVYSPETDKTYFCYGAVSSQGSLIHAVSCYDHKTKAVTRPVGVIDKKTTDAHDNPVLCLDDKGYIWLFSTSHGTSRPSYIHRSTKPYDINEFELISPFKSEDGKKVPLDNFSYLQVYFQKGRGFLGLFTHYVISELKYGKKSVRVISWMKSPDGINWSEWKDIAAIEEGHYQTSFFSNGKAGTSFNYHPNLEKEPGLNYRTNLYYLETDDFGVSWHTVYGKKLSLPLKDVDNEAIVADYASRGLNVYINDVAFDESGYPAILYITSKGYQAGPVSGPQEWHIAHWNGKSWDIGFVTRSDNNYDMGSLYIESEAIWRIIGPTEPGPQQYNTGGEMAMWLSADGGKSWKMDRQLTAKSRFNHSYARKPLILKDDFYAIWADGHGRTPSESGIWFCTKNGEVFCLPQKMRNDTEKVAAYRIIPSLK